MKKLTNLWIEKRNIRLAIEKSLKICDYNAYAYEYIEIEKIFNVRYHNYILCSIYVYMCKGNWKSLYSLNIIRCYISINRCYLCVIVLLILIF